VDDRWRVSTPAKAGHRPSSWYRFGGSGLTVHHFEVWRRDKETQSSFTDDVGDVERNLRNQTPLSNPQMRHGAAVEILCGFPPTNANAMLRLHSV